MQTLAQRMKKALVERQQAGLLRQLPPPITGQIDFCSNDYLGLARTLTPPTTGAGGTGSRLISGNTDAAVRLETKLAAYHKTEAALLFPSGYAANIGLIPAVTSRQDTIIYDRLLHASLRDGISLSQARALGFQHNDLADLEKKLSKAEGEKWVIIESVYSMDGDQPPLEKMVGICQKHQAHIIIDEAHGTGVLGKQGEGLVSALGLEAAVWARVHTFGKAIGGHGAVVLGSQLLKEYLVNFARSFIYTTALPPASITHIEQAYDLLQSTDLTDRLRERIAYIHKGCPDSLRARLIPSSTPIQAVLCPGNTAVQELAQHLQAKKMAVLPIRYPTVPQGEERIRICLHTFNTNEEIDQLLASLEKYFNQH